MRSACPAEVMRLQLESVVEREPYIDYELSLEEGSINERVEQLRERLSYSVSEVGRTQIMADIDTIDALDRSAALFTRRPRSTVIARPYPEFRWPESVRVVHGPAARRLTTRRPPDAAPAGSAHALRAAFARRSRDGARSPLPDRARQRERLAAGIVELRERAREALGPRLLLAEFHDVVLRLGSVPFGVMEGEVERWIERAR